MEGYIYREWPGGLMATIGVNLELETDRASLMEESLSLKGHFENAEAGRTRAALAQMTFIERMKQRLNNQTCIIFIHDQYGMMPIETRFMTNGEIEAVKRFQELMVKTSTEDENPYFDALNGFKEMADKITMGPVEFTGGFWSNPDSSTTPGDVIEFVLDAINETITAIGAAKSFRAN